MGMEMRMTQRLSQRQELRQSLTLQQRLIQDMRITPMTTCPLCGYICDPDNEDGWSTTDPYDFHITCAKCGHRFIGQLLVEPRESVVETRSSRRGRVLRSHHYEYLCPMQVTQALRDIRNSRKPRRAPGMQWLHDNRPEVLFSAVKNFGSLDDAKRRAFN